VKTLWGAAALLLTAATAPPWSWDLPADTAAPPVPADNPMSAAKVELGRRLFYDADLSLDGTLACAGCHEQKRAFADGNATRPGVHGNPGRRNAPGLANVAWLPRLTFADPSLTSLEAQVLVPLVGENPVEMGMKGEEAEIGRRLGADRCYRHMFAKAFPERQGRIDLPNVAAALAAFQRTMIAFDSPYDRAGRGDPSALTPLQVEGRSLFQSTGCASCHSGQLFTDAGYHRLGNPAGADRGLAEHTGQTSDAWHFRTPSLRNVAVTGPWWHDGSSSTLEHAINRHPVVLPDGAVKPLLAFLDALTDKQFLVEPRLARPDWACGKRL
jgi:cytochrome c peroxidase